MGKYPVNCYPWGGAYQPRAEAILERHEGALRLKMTAWEPSIAAAETRTGGMVCRDSCLEFFFQPLPETDARYINVEVNAVGVMHIGIGAGREGRTVLSELPEGVRPVVHIVAGTKWSVRYDLPIAWIAGLFPGFAPAPGGAIRGNFYCCDETIHPHFGCAFPVVAPEPDFHRPESFRELHL